MLRMDILLLQRHVRWKLAMHIAGETFAGDKAMNVGACNPAPFLKEGDKLVQNTGGPELLKRARPLVRKYIAHCNKQGQSKVAKKEAASSLANLEWSRGQPTIESSLLWCHPEETQQLDCSIALFVYHHALPFNALDSPEFQAVIDTAIYVGATGASGNYRPPGRNLFGGGMEEANIQESGFASERSTPFSWFASSCSSRPSRRQSSYGRNISADFSDRFSARKSSNGGASRND